MKASRITKLACSVALATACAFGLASCGGNSDSQQVAATVNGEPIYEQTITDYVQNFREAQDLTDDAAWGEWMASMSFTPEEVRSDVIDYYVSQELVLQAAEENGVAPEQSAIDEAVNTMKSNYDSDQAWQEALAAVGTTEEAYRGMIELSMAQEALQENVIQVEEVTDEEIIESAATYYDGTKRSSHILFAAEDEATAQEVLDQINAGTLDFAEAAKQYSTDSSAEDGGDVGWDALTSFVTEYQDALDGLALDQVSGLVVSDYGIHIIKCTDVFDASTVTSVDQIPSDLADPLRSMLESQKQSEAYNAWFESYRETAEIVVNDMPEGLIYDIDMTPYLDDSSDEGSSDGSAEGATDGAGDAADDGSDATADDTAADGSDAVDGDASADGADSEESSTSSDDGNAASDEDSAQ